MTKKTINSVTKESHYTHQKFVSYPPWNKKTTKQKLVRTIFLNSSIVKEK
ncbi:MAG: hypothetical protein U9O78_04155 [Patescibacteria group bacterium]|nr:hypothetical protein [Patescibacteria group bacterium]